MGIRINLLRSLLLLTAFVLVLACSKRPTPIIAPNFSEKKPQKVLVMPAVYFPAEKVATPPTVDSPEYVKAALNPKFRENRVLVALEHNVASNLKSRGMSVVETDQVMQEIFESRSAYRLNWQDLAARLNADAIIFTTIFLWNMPDYDPTGFAYGGNRRTDIWQVPKHNVPKSGVVKMEIALFETQNKDLLWSDRNFPPEVAVARKRKTGPVENISEQVVATTFESFPTP